MLKKWICIDKQGKTAVYFNKIKGCDKVCCNIKKNRLGFVRNFHKFIKNAKIV